MMIYLPAISSENTIDFLYSLLGMDVIEEHIVRQL